MWLCDYCILFSFLAALNYMTAPIDKNASCLSLKLSYFLSFFTARHVQSLTALPLTRRHLITKCRRGQRWPVVPRQSVTVAPFDPRNSVAASLLGPSKTWQTSDASQGRIPRGLPFNIHPASCTMWIRCGCLDDLPGQQLSNLAKTKRIRRMATKHGEAWCFVGASGLALSNSACKSTELSRQQRYGFAHLAE